ncbi:hypothetical protein KCTC52924_03634 [Arenibacter antarcticus]|uniref:YtxH domain-containing protein n=1 Tax=Arenibacter antarcticus TaxID=2040469 RepID=A0ABW5VG51_9FLAO|nr:YtxH domain-containing protein [Arenibacter sp. H213]MCM4168082.1 hypothetical protein [Arenibacter sp. H213]
MKTNNKKGILALLGIGAGAWAFWKYKTMPPEKKEALKSSINEAGDKLKKTVNELESKVAENYDRTKNSAKEKLKEMTK